MKLTDLQFEAAVYIFENSHGNKNSHYEERIIAESGISHIPLKTLAEFIVKALDEEIYKTSEERINAYWALSKLHEKPLVPKYKQWLKNELILNENGAIYQIMVALDYLEESIFNTNRKGSSAYYEEELNKRDAKVYLNLE